ncbi:hypothetical protein K505DRAFT_353362 [Melanomma pulvis-pyrius CBS 109.77]|uniref:Uncharacterized protein n=1 Tax=Melanomma pulvis-pyrius CBS 109.77 TaxID=1314802 RepID=A0A6A6WWC4_9PLEO|nr:hypothetical protein K505DRAFT_353362 [Melanomma pulvis-pyrius CBS 109.77]
MSPNAPLTPGDDQDPSPTAPVIDYSPPTVPYNAVFENALMTAILYPSDNNPPAPPRQQTSDTNPNSDSTLHIDPTTLPVPLTSPLRTHPSPIPGVLLTHANGYHTGGPGPTPSSVAEFAEKFIKDHGIEDAGQLERVVEAKIQEMMEIVRERMREREKAVKHNEGIERELSNLEELRNVERRVAERIKEGRRKRGEGGEEAMDIDE